MLLFLPVGNAPWPIGVTSVGIHERSSREKISHVTGMNVRGEAHVMNDEATRKWLQVLPSFAPIPQQHISPFSLNGAYYLGMRPPPFSAPFS